MSLAFILNDLLRTGKVRLPAGIFSGNEIKPNLVEGQV